MLIRPNSTAIAHLTGLSGMTFTDGFHSLAQLQEAEHVNRYVDVDDEVSGWDMVLESELGQDDVICGRSKMAFNNVGNRRFRATISLALEHFMKASERKDKSVVIGSVTDLLLSNSGRFLQQVHKNKGGRSGLVFYALTKKQSRLKVGHALRDMALAASRADGLAWRALPTTSSAVLEVVASNATSPSSKELRTTLPCEVSPVEDRRLSRESVLSETDFESLFQLVAISNVDAAGFDFTDDISIAPVDVNGVDNVDLIHNW
jgi:hypothetical protein